MAKFIDIIPYLKSYLTNINRGITYEYKGEQ